MQIMPLFLCLHNLFWVVLLAKGRWLFVRGIHWIYNLSYYLISDILNLYYHFRKYMLYFLQPCVFKHSIYMYLCLSLSHSLSVFLFLSLSVCLIPSLYMYLCQFLSDLCLFLSVSLVYVGNGFFRKAKINYSGVDYRGSKTLSLAIRRDFSAYTKNIDNCL